MKFRKTVSIILALFVMLTVLGACGTPDTPQNPDEYTGAMLENGNTYADPNWMPVVKNPITIQAIVRDPLISGNVFNERTIWKEFGETTGVNIELQVTTAAEPEQLMFASRNYPDVAFRIFVEEMQTQACYAGDIIELTDEMLETYAPNYYELFTSYSDIYRMCLLPDSKLYFLPQWVMAEDAYMLRDCFWINEAWLDELGLEIPTTTDEYINYLRAVKNAAGQGSIPDNVAPLYLRCNLVNIGSYYSVLDWYGCFNGFAGEIVEDGVVKHQSTNAGIKPAFQYLAQIYREGLVNDNCMKGDWTEYQTAIGNDYDGSSTPWVGSFFGYSISPAMKEDYAAIAPLDTGTGAPSYIRSFGADNRIIDKALCIFSTSQYPIAILRAFDHYATGEGAMRAVIGEEGEDLQWYKKDDGTYIYADNAWDNYDNTNSYGWNDYGPGVVTTDYVEQLNRNDMEDEDERVYLYENLYKQYHPTNMTLYPVDAINYLTPDEASEAELIRTKVNQIVSKFARQWIQGKTDVDDDWDMYIIAIKNSGIERRLELLQKAYDAYMANTVE